MASDDSQIFAIALDATVLLLKEFLNAVHRTKEDISELIRHATVTSRIKMKVAAMDFVGKLMGCALDVSLDRAQDLGRMRVAIFRFVLENDLLDVSLATTANVLAMEVQSAVSQLTSGELKSSSSVGRNHANCLLQLLYESSVLNFFQSSYGLIITSLRSIRLIFSISLIL